MYIVGYIQGDWETFHVPVFVTEDKEKAKVWKEKYDKILDRLLKTLYTEDELSYSWGSPTLEAEEVSVWGVSWQEKIANKIGAYIEEVEKR